MPSFKSIKNTFYILSVMVITSVFIGILFKYNILTQTNMGGITESTLYTINIFIWVFIWIIRELL